MGNDSGNLPKERPQFAWFYAFSLSAIFEAGGKNGLTIFLVNEAFIVNRVES